MQYSQESRAQLHKHLYYVSAVQFQSIETLNFPRRNAVRILQGHSGRPLFQRTCPAFLPLFSTGSDQVDYYILKRRSHKVEQKAN